jgi:hypothetical protein
VSPVKYELGFYIPEEVILHSHRRENLNSYNILHSLYNTKLSIQKYPHKGPWRPIGLRCFEDFSLDNRLTDGVLYSP